jgi:hypothetical protein
MSATDTEEGAKALICRGFCRRALLVLLQIALLMKNATVFQQWRYVKIKI